MQSDKNKNAIYIQREKIHNAMNLSFSIFGFLLMVVVSLLSIIKEQYLLLSYGILFIILMSSRIAINIKLMFSFKKLVNKINPDNLDFYITKSWTRKREGAIWVGLIYIFTIAVFLALNAMLHNVFDVPSSGNEYIVYLILTIHLFIIIIIMYTNIQMTNDYIKVAEKRINIHSVEWEQIRKDQSNYYKQLFIWYIHLIFVLPLILMLVPPYRRFWNNK